MLLMLEIASRLAFSETLKEMFGVSSLPPMPSNGTWSVMHSWVLSTNCFVEFVIFSRIFVDKLDAQFYDEHRKTGRCYLSLSEDNNCYCRILELLINVWAYHSAKIMVYVDPITGLMKEQHEFDFRRGLMWVGCPECQILESMKEKLAEELNRDGPKRPMAVAINRRALLSKYP